MGPADQLGERVFLSCKEAGFALAGVCEASPSGRAAELAAWLGAGKHGSMEYLARNTDVRVDVRRLLEGARSVVMVADQYASRQWGPDVPTPEGAGLIARYARGDDYHEVMKSRLHAVCDALRDEFPAEQFRAFVDTAPVQERELAARAGLGWIGKHTLLISPRLGSWFFLGGFATTLEINPPADQSTISDHCGTCTRCIDACPTGAITPYSVDARRCISYLTIEQRKEIDPALAPGIGPRLFGCDVCQEVCPHNSPRQTGETAGTPRHEYAGRTSSLELLALLGWTQEDRSRVLRKSAIKRATLSMLKRNAILALLNGPKAVLEEASPELARLAGDDGEDEQIRELARGALRTLGRG